MVLYLTRIPYLSRSARANSQVQGIAARPSLDINREILALRASIISADSEDEKCPEQNAGYREIGRAWCSLLTT